MGFMLKTNTAEWPLLLFTVWCEPVLTQIRVSPFTAAVVKRILQVKVRWFITWFFKWIFDIYFRFPYLNVCNEDDRPITSSIWAATTLLWHLSRQVTNLQKQSAPQLILQFNASYYVSSQTVHCTHQRWGTALWSGVHPLPWESAHIWGYFYCQLRSGRPHVYNARVSNAKFWK